MKYLSLAVLILTACLADLSRAEENGSAQPAATAKIVKEIAFETKPAMIAATAYVKAADFAPEGGWGEEDYEGAIDAMVMNGSTRVINYTAEKSIQPAGAMFAVWYQDPTTTKPTDLTSKWCVPIADDNEPTPEVTVEKLPAMDALTVTYEGHPNSAMNVWTELTKYAEANEYEWTGAPMEVYHSVGGKEPGADRWKVEIVWPVKKKKKS